MECHNSEAAAQDRRNKKAALANSDRRFKKSALEATRNSVQSTWHETADQVGNCLLPRIGCLLSVKRLIGYEKIRRVHRHQIVRKSPAKHPQKSHIFIRLLFARPLYENILLSTLYRVF